MFTRVPQPLKYADALLAQFVSLSRAADGAGLLGSFVLGQLHLLQRLRLPVGDHASSHPFCFCQRRPQGSALCALFSPGDPLMSVRHWQAVLLTLVVLCGLGGCSGNYKFNDNIYRPLGDPQAVNRGK